MSAPRSGTRCSFTTDIGGGSVQCDAYQGHPGPHTAMVPGRVVVVDTTTSDGKIADLARAYGKAYAAWVLARLDNVDLVETTMNYVAAERALRAAVCPDALATEEALP